MIYRDDGLVARVASLRRELAALRRRPQPRAVRKLRAGLGRERRRRARALRAIASRGSGWRPGSVTELVVALAISGTVITLALGVAFLVVCVSALIRA